MKSKSPMLNLLNHIYVKVTARNADGKIDMVRMGLTVSMIAVSVGAQTSDTIPLLRDCSNADAEELVATVQKTDRVQVRYGLSGNTQTCYAVSTTVNGKSVEGYLLGAAHPDVAAFERNARSRVPEIPAPTEPARVGETPHKDLTPKAPKSFAGLSGTSPDGRRISLSQLSAPTVVLYFWSANNKQSIREADGMDGVYELYRNKGVGLVGVVSGASVTQVRRVISDEEVIWPQILDHGDIAARYPASKETKYFILNRNRNVVAALNSPSEVQRELTKLRRGTGGAQ